MNKEQENEQIKIFHDRCRANNLRITPQRTVIYRSLAGAKDHPTAEAVYKKVRQKLPHISFDTVNRTLVSFAKIGILRVVEGWGQARRYDPDLHEHHHFYCLGCGKIIDYDCTECDRVPLPDEIRKGCRVVSRRFVIEGYCPDCR